MAHVEALWRDDPACAASDAALIRAAVARKLHLFKGFADYGKRDLITEGAIAVARAEGDYDAARSRSTWVSMIVGRRLLDLHKQLDRRAKRETRVAVDRDAAAKVVEWIDVTRADALPGSLGGDDETVEDWAAGVYGQAVRTFPRHYHVRGNKRYTAPQALVAVLVMRRLSLGVRRAARLFAESKDMRDALRMKQAPSREWFHRATQLVTRKMKIPFSGGDLGGGE